MDDYTDHGLPWWYQDEDRGPYLEIDVPTTPDLKPGDEVIRVGCGAFRYLGTVGTVEAVAGGQVRVLWHTRTHPRSSDGLLGKRTWVRSSGLRRYPEEN